MAKKGISQTDLEQGIIGSAPAAERIADVMRLFPMVLVREDPAGAGGVSGLVGADAR